MYGQNNLINKTIKYQKGDTIQLSSYSILKTGFEVYHKKNRLVDSTYFFDPITAKFFSSSAPSALLTFKYYRSPININQSFYHKLDTLIVDFNDSLALEPYRLSIKNNNDDLNFFGDSQLEKQGSISRGVTVGNAQSLSFQSTLNLQLNGVIGPNLFIKGSISDNNIPFQPSGNTQKLQEFDQVFLQIYNDDFAVTGGDFWLKKPTGYFLNYNKRSQGLSVDYNYLSANIKNSPKISHKIGGAFSRGKFARNILQGIEGNQGPYKLSGVENEQNIIVLAGTEAVYIDGKLLERGQEFDYTIDYNTAEIIFTANQFITKDKRIIVEFQYSDLNYARSLGVYNGKVEGEKYTIWGNFYNEQDAKNQPIQQSLSFEQKTNLSFAGDDLNNALISSIIPTEYSENTIHYFLKDSLGIDSVLVFTNNVDSAKYRANFKLLGENKGNYIIDKYTANGKIYKWVFPTGGIPQGTYEPVILLIAPQKKQMASVGASYQFNPNVSTTFELAYSRTDKNTFSELDAGDDKGYALKWGVGQQKQIKDKGITLYSNLDLEINDRNFNPIQWFRSAEFDRDWNLSNQAYTGNQYISKVQIGIQKNKVLKISYQINQLTWGEAYQGLKNDVDLNLFKNGYTLNFKGNYLTANGDLNSKFFRHQAEVSKTWKKIKIGYVDIYEKNIISISDSLLPSAYQFYDAKAYISTGDSTKNYHQIYYQLRTDWLSDTNQLTPSANAENYGISSQFNKNKYYQLKVNLNYRRLKVLDENLFDQPPENTMLGRVEQNLFFLKGVFSSRTFYEVNSGLELKRDYVYVQVNNGQGVYTWIDYNEDGIKDIGEFEIAQFSDQAEYIRISISSTEFVRTYGNQFNQTFFLKPEKIWRQSKGIKGFLGLFSNQTNYKINRKTTNNDQLLAINPFLTDIPDSSLINVQSNLRNTLFFNRLNPKFGLEYTITATKSKVLLTSGFDFNQKFDHENRLRWNISKAFNLNLKHLSGFKKSASDYAENRNYFYQTQLGELTISYQPNTKFRYAILGEFSIKKNESDLNEIAKSLKIGNEIRFNQVKKGSFSANFNLQLLAYNAAENTPIAFELLAALKPGVNLLWGLNYQRKIAENLQLNFNYSGRKSENVAFIHSGGMELRAFF
ncbi:hypothetical protein DNU06_02980 [Putridiphycobacter roseus]|uniref:Uncharacterized protein n=1 Tax=Putridiphycobacter roseus TaxID=2219161 RepID=A0A2W1N5E7_9FLAO|nr:hypothetical protein DNU06_02980 [Putridiphycobacter roseus]